MNDRTRLEIQAYVPLEPMLRFLHSSASPNEKDEKTIQDLIGQAVSWKTYKAPGTSPKYFHDEGRRTEPKILSSSMLRFCFHAQRKY